MTNLFRFFTLSFIILLISCDSNRVYEVNNSFENQFWFADSAESFKIAIEDKSKKYNVYLNIRNSAGYPYNNIYVKYNLADTLGTIFEEQLINNQLFDAKTGKPLGQSGIGDLFDNQFVILENYSFDHSGSYIFNIEHYMRNDSLPGILAVGVRVEMVESGD